MTAPSLASAAAVARAVAERQVSPLELVDEALQRIERMNPALNAFLAVRERARAEARAAERKGPRGALGALHGVPISVKDLILTRDLPTTAGSKIFGPGLTSRRDAPVLRRLRRAGAIIIGKNNLHELALGVTNLNAHFGPARNPWNPELVPGGSSGGSAVAVAAGLGCASVGTDTRGSIRIPAACCGVTGLKPSYGLVPVEDVIPLAWSLDHVGPITRSVEDAALMLGAMVGRAATHRYLAALERPLAPLRFGLCPYLLRDLDEEIERAVRQAIDLLRETGATVREVALPEADDTHEMSRVITLAEALTYHDRHLREHPEGFGAGVRERLEGGRSLSAVELVRAERQKVAVTRAFDRVFEEVDCILGATLPAFPSRIGDDAIRVRGRETTVLAEYPRLTCPANMAGVPALSLPCGFGTNGLPIGLQLIAGRGREEVLLTAGGQYQRMTDWHTRRPPAAAGF